VSKAKALELNNMVDALRREAATFLKMKAV
jgi:hypothetical protein